MFPINSKKIASALFFCFITALSVVMVSCQKEISSQGFLTTEIQPDLTTTIITSVSGFVTDETGKAVSGAIAQVGTKTTTTDKYGYFEVRNTDVIKNAAFVSVIKSGYFKGIKIYTATAGKAAFFRIKLIPKKNVGSMDAATGGSVALTNGLSILLPANAVVIAATNAAYSGQVQVAASWLNPTAADLNLIMPGDLRGLDSQGFMKLLTTYGMCAVELTGASGELLQIGNGKKATLSFPLPDVLVATAPASIPLWYMDETIGLWKEEGSATKAGNKYVGEVTHFSYWNCDIPLENAVQFTATIIDAIGKPMPNVSVSIQYANGSHTGAHGYTDSTGFINGTIPANAQLILKLFSDYNCNGPVYTQTLVTTNVNLSLGNITVGPGISASINGNVSNCINMPVTSGYVIIQQDNLNSRTTVNADGTFNVNILKCDDASNPFTITAVDAVSNQQSIPLITVPVNGNNSVGTLNACGTSVAEFINFSVNGTNYSLIAPLDSVAQERDSSGNNTMADLFIGGLNRINFDEIGFSVSKQNIVQGSTQTLKYFESTVTGETNAGNAGAPVINLNITEYGSIGQFISGNFTGTVNGTSLPVTAYTITCNFRVRRKE